MDFVRIGNGYPQLIGCEDRWSQPVDGIQTNGYGYVPRQMWMGLQCFQTPVSPYEYEREELERLGLFEREANTYLINSTFEKVRSSLFGRRLESIMRLSGSVSTAWEFNAYTEPDEKCTDRVRFCAFLGEQRLIEWSDTMLAMHRQNEVIAKLYNANVRAK